MAYKAFIIGINTLGLKYCDRDADLMKYALSKRGYNVNVINKEAKKYDIMPKYIDILGDCRIVDTLIFFFSGHGKPIGRELFLFTKGDGSDELNKIPISEILGPLERCAAKNKLVILDCCRAGRLNGSGEWNCPEPGDFYRILVAANPLEKAKEIDDLRASFLTHKIHSALTNPPEAILDKGKIRINNLSDWLRKQADLHNVSSLIKVPRPYLIGADRADFEICILEKSLIEPMEGKTIINDRQLIDEIREWKVIHTKSQSLQDHLAEMIRHLHISRFEPFGSKGFNNSMQSAENEWIRCASYFKEILEDVKGFRYIAANEAVLQCLPYATEPSIKPILDRIRIAKSPEDALDIQRLIVDIKQVIDEMLHVADKQIVLLVDKLAIKSSSETIEANHVVTEA